MIPVKYDYTNHITAKMHPNIKSKTSHFTRQSHEFVDAIDKYSTLYPLVSQL